MTKQVPSKVSQIDDSSSVSPKTISEALGIDPLLPGERAGEYQQGLKALIAELDAKSPLQIYLAEKIYDSLWWIRRYEDQKRTTIIVQMSKQVGVPSEKDKSRMHTPNDFREMLFAGDDGERVRNTASALGHSLASLRQDAMFKVRDQLQQLDQQIALHARLLAGFQASYEVAFNRKRNVARLDLQNALLRRDLEAIEGEVVSDKPKTKGR